MSSIRTSVVGTVVMATLLCSVLETVVSTDPRPGLGRSQPQDVDAADRPASAEAETDAESDGVDLAPQGHLGLACTVAPWAGMLDSIHGSLRGSPTTARLVNRRAADAIRGPPARG